MTHRTLIKACLVADVIFAAGFSAAIVTGIRGLAVLAMPLALLAGSFVVGLCYLRWPTDGEGEQGNDAGEPTHVLVWSPEYLSEDGPARWELLTAAEFGTYRGTDDPPCLNLPRDAEAGELLAGVSSLLGHLVTLSPDTCKVARRHFARRRSEPIYYLRPVVMPAATPAPADR